MTRIMIKHINLVKLTS